MNTEPFKRFVLDNGVRVILVHMEGMNSLATSVMVGVGSRYEPRSMNGISHFLEHMVFKGTAKYPTTDDVNIIERQGGLQNAYTDIDITNYHNKTLASDWELGLEVNKELALFPRFEQKFIDKERNVVLEEMKRYDDEPAAKVEEEFQTLMYPNTPLGMRIIGEVESLTSVTSTELKRYHEQWYRPNKMVVVLAGGINGHEEVILSRVREWFGSLTGHTEETFAPVSIVQTEPRCRVYTKPDANQAHLELGVRTFARSSEERFAWGVFNLLMGVSFTSRLFKEIREKRGLCYQIHSSSDNWADCGNWSIYAGVATDTVEEAVKETLSELTKVVQEGVKEEEVVVAKKRLKTMIAFRAEDPEFQNEYYGRQEVFNQEIVNLKDYLSKIEAVTAADVNALARKYLITNTLNLAVVWNKPNDEKLLDLLKI